MNPRHLPAGAAVAAALALAACSGGDVVRHDMGDGVVCYELQESSGNTPKGIDCVAASGDLNGDR
jgi:hypothetical protein